MATAMAFPEAKRGGDRKSSFFEKLENASDVSKGHISKARYVLRNNITPENQQYPDRCLAVMAGTMTLTEAYALLDEARETDRLIKRHINTTRYLLLDMRDRKGWKALGYESFVEYGEKELIYSTAKSFFRRCAENNVLCLDCYHHFEQVARRLGSDVQERLRQYQLIGWHDRHQRLYELRRKNEPRRIPPRLRVPRWQTVSSVPSGSKTPFAVPFTNSE